MYVPGSHTGQRKVSDPLELRLQKAVSYHVGATGLSVGRETRSCPYVRLTVLCD